MKTFTKLLRGTLLFAIVACVQFGLGSVDASASTIQTKDITIDYDKQQLKITESTTTKDLEVYYAVATVKNVKKKDASGKYVVTKVLNAATWDSFDYKAGLTIDLSKLNRAKDNYIQLKGSKNADPLTIKIPAVRTKVSAKFDAVNAQVTMNDVTNKKAPVVLVSETVEYRTAYSGWKTYSNDDLSIYQTNGATLYFRLAAHDSQTVNKTAATATTSDLYDATGNAVSIYEVGSFPGVEAKVVIGKRANAPKVTVDYNKQQFTLPKNTEYRVVTSSKINAWTAASTTAATKLNLSDISSLVGSLTSATLEVRTAATATKPASKINHIDFNMPETISAKSTNTTANKTDAARLAYDVSANYVGASTTSQDLTVSYVYSAKTKKYTGIKFTNTTANTYQILVLDAGSDAPTAAATGMKTISPGKADSTGTITPKETTISVKDGQVVYIRIIGNTKTKEWATDFKGLGTIKFPVDPPSAD